MWKHSNSMIDGEPISVVEGNELRVFLDPNFDHADKGPDLCDILNQLEGEKARLLANLKSVVRRLESHVDDHKPRCGCPSCDSLRHAREALSDIG